MAVDAHHKDYDKYLPRWELVRDCVEGSAAIKSRSGSSYSLGGMSGTRYLPAPNPEDVSTENQNRYADYRTRANYVNFTGSTEEGLTGMIFRKPMEVELPPTLEYMSENATGAGLSIQQLAQGLANELQETGRFGILVDYPAADSGLTKAQVDAQKLQANLIGYPAEAVINWKTDMIGAVKKLTMVVLKECVEVYHEDGFGSETETRYRVLLLKGGVYVQNLYNKDKELLAIDGETDITPRTSTGSTWKEIPFIFIGAENNDDRIDKAPLYDIAEVNIAHYRNSADSEESSYMVGQPTPVIAGLNQSWVDENFKQGVFLGSRRSIPLPDGGSASLLQAESNILPDSLADKKEIQMVKLGARIIQDSSGVETAEAAKIRFAGQNSKLALIVENIEKGLLVCADWAMEFMGGTGEAKIEMNRQFYDISLDPQLVIAQIQLMDRGVIAKQDLRRTLRQGNAIASDRTDEDIDAEAETQEVL